MLRVKVKWCIYIAPFSCNMLKGALQWSVYPQRNRSIYRRKWQPLQISPCMLVLILLTPEGWKAEGPLAGKKVTQIFNPRPGQESNWGPQDWEAEIFTTAPTPPLLYNIQHFSSILYPTLPIHRSRMDKLKSWKQKYLYVDIDFIWKTTVTFFVLEFWTLAKMIKKKSDHYVRMRPLMRTNFKDFQGPLAQLCSKTAGQNWICLDQKIVFFFY